MWYRSEHNSPKGPLKGLEGGRFKEMENLSFVNPTDRGLLHGGGEGEQAGAAARRDGQGAQQQGDSGGDF